MNEENISQIKNDASCNDGAKISEFVKHTGEIWRCGNLYRTARNEVLGLGSYQDSYILNVCAYPGVTQEELSRKIFVHKSNVARQLSLLEEKGFIRRTTDPSDKRNLLVYPTEKAYAVLDKIKQVNEEWNSLVLSNLTEEEKAAVEKYSAIIADTAKKIIEKVY